MHVARTDLFFQTSKTVQDNMRTNQININNYFVDECLFKSSSALFDKKLAYRSLDASLHPLTFSL